ncbi:hypothetical protein LTR15_005588 [Elasticomyces elasticus]|nr:hypothetical protein LTR15_005588 [Elasticomyces elasticus]
MKDQEIFAADPKTWTDDELFELSTRYQPKEIAQHSNAGRGTEDATGVGVRDRLRRTITRIADRQGRPRDDVRAELDALRQGRLKWSERHISTEMDEIDIYLKGRYRKLYDKKWKDGSTYDGNVESLLHDLNERFRSGSSEKPILREEVEVRLAAIRQAEGQPHPERLGRKGPQPKNGFCSQKHMSQINGRRVRYRKLGLPVPDVDVLLQQVRNKVPLPSLSGLATTGAGRISEQSDDMHEASLKHAGGNKYPKSPSKNPSDFIAPKISCTLDELTDTPFHDQHPPDTTITPFPGSGTKRGTKRSAQEAGLNDRVSPSAPTVEGSGLIDSTPVLDPEAMIRPPEQELKNTSNLTKDPQNVQKPAKAARIDVVPRAPIEQWWE